MANYDSANVRKKNNHRGTHAGQLQSVSGVLRVAAGSSIATTDLIRMIPMGENTRPTKLTLTAITVSGTPSLTNATFSAGVSPKSQAVRADGTTYPVLSASATALSASMAIDSDGMAAASEIGRPSANAKYGQYYITLTPAGAGAFSVSGGDIDLVLTAEFAGEANPPLVYTEFVNQNVNNQT